MKNDLLKEIFRTDSQQTKFIVSGLERLLGDDVTEELLQELMPQAPTSQSQYKGHPLSFYAGLGRAKLETFFGLTSTEVDEVFEKLGVQESAEEKKAAEAEIKAFRDGGGEVKAPIATTEAAVSGAVDSQPESPETSEEVVVEDAPKGDEFSYVKLLELGKDELVKMAKDREIEFKESDKEQTLASLISKFEKAKATE